MVSGTTRTIDPYYSFPLGGESGVRLGGVIYPNGIVITAEYESGLDDELNRLSGRKLAGTTWLFRESYLGLGRLLERTYGAPGAPQWQISLDRFGRPEYLTVENASVNYERYWWNSWGIG